jgi:hypothetical protein
VVARASESLEELMISDKELPKPVDEIDSHFKTRHHDLQIGWPNSLG